MQARDTSINSDNQGRVSLTSLSVPDLLETASFSRLRSATFRIPGEDGCPSREVTSVAVNRRAGLITVSSRLNIFWLRIPGPGENPVELKPFHVIRDREAHSAVFRPDGEWLLTAGWNLAMKSGFDLYQIRQEGSRIMPVCMHSLPSKGLPSCAAFSSDGALLAAGDLSGNVGIYDASGLDQGKAPEQISEIRRGRHVFDGPWVMSVDFTPGGEAVVIAYDDGVVRLVSLINEEGKAEKFLPPRVPASEMLPIDSPEISWWNALVPRRSFLPGRPLPAQLDKKQRLHFLHGTTSDDGSLYAFAGQVNWFVPDRRGGYSFPSQIKVLDLTATDAKGRPSPEQIASIRLDREVHSISFLPDRRHLIVATQDRLVYDLPSGETKAGDPGAYLLLLELDRSGPSATLHIAGLLEREGTWLKAALSEDAGAIAVGGYDGLTHIFY